MGQIGVSRWSLKGGEEGGILGFPGCQGKPQAQFAESAPTIPCSVSSPTHLEADTHVGCHYDLVAFAVHLCAPQELTLG